MSISKEELNILLKECQLNKHNNPAYSLSKLHAIADDLIGHVERSHDIRKIFSVLLKDAI
ncbi:unnamed protein product, partial [Adineta steineri]